MHAEKIFSSNLTSTNLFNNQDCSIKQFIELAQIKYVDGPVCEALSRRDFIWGAPSLESETGNQFVERYS